MFCNLIRGRLNLKVCLLLLLFFSVVESRAVVTSVVYHLVRFLQLQLSLLAAVLFTMTAVNDFYYSSRYEDEEYEYRHVHVPKEVARLVPKNRLMSESEWRSLGVQQSPGWIHYLIHEPERHILLFRRPKPAVAAEPLKTQPNGLKSGLGVR